jgi:uncharacterized protein (DUF433 family)
VLSEIDATEPAKSVLPDARCRLRFDSGRNIKVAALDKADLSRITVVPDQRSGQPCIRGLRISVWDVLDMLASGMTQDEILSEYPYLEKADFPAVYAYASQMGRERVAR